MWEKGPEREPGKERPHGDQMKAAALRLCIC